jgi:aspartate/methionine/tyrosine aminotransferase
VSPFSSRTPSSLAPNRLSLAIARARETGRDLLDLTLSNPTRAGFHCPADLLAPLADARGLTYAPRPFGLPAAREAVAADYARRGIAVAADRIVLTASTSEAYSLLFKLLADPGDEILVPRPSYPLFEHLTRLDALAAVPYDLDPHGEWAIDVAGLERAISARTRAILLVSPNNPTGSYVSREDLDAVGRLAAASGLALIVDEVFAEYELTRGAAARAGRVLDSRDALVFALGGLSKSAGLPQVKLGWIAAAGPDALVTSALERLELVCDTYLSVSTPVQVAAAELMARGAAIRVQIQARIAENLSRLAERVAATPSCRVLPAQGGWYAVLQVPRIESEEDLVIGLLERHAIVVHPGYFFDFPSEAFLVVSLLPSPEPFSAAVDLILRHFDCSVGRHA